MDNLYLWVDTVCRSVSVCGRGEACVRFGSVPVVRGRSVQVRVRTAARHRYRGGLRSQREVRVPSCIAPWSMVPSGIVPSGIAPSGIAPWSMPPSGIVASGMPPSGIAPPPVGISLIGYRAVKPRPPPPPPLRPLLRWVRGYPTPPTGISC